MSLTSAKKFVREELAELSERQPDTGVERIPASPPGNGRVTQRVAAKETYLTPEERQAKKDEGYTDKQLDIMEAEYQDRKARGGGK